MIFTNVDRWYYFSLSLPTGLFSTELVFELVNLAIMEKSIFKNTYILTTMLTDGWVIWNLKLPKGHKTSSKAHLVSKNSSAHLTLAYLATHWEVEPLAYYSTCSTTLFEKIGIYCPCVVKVRSGHFWTKQKLQEISGLL